MNEQLMLQKQIFGDDAPTAVKTQKLGYRGEQVHCQKYRFFHGREG